MFHLITESFNGKSIYDQIDSDQSMLINTVSDAVKDYLEKEDFFVAESETAWQGFSKYEKSMQYVWSEDMTLDEKIADWKDTGIGGYFTFNGTLVTHESVVGRVKYWGNGDPEILDLKVMTDDITEIEETVLIEYDEQKIEECFEEYLERTKALEK